MDSDDFVITILKQRSVTTVVGVASSGHCFIKEQPRIVLFFDRLLTKKEVIALRLART